eukprot:1031592-Amphidinium_carterae.1
MMPPGRLALLRGWAATHRQGSVAIMGHWYFPKIFQTMKHHVIEPPQQMGNIEAGASVVVMGVEMA